MRFQQCLAKRKHSMKDGNCHDNVKGTTVEVKGKTFKDGLLLFFKMHINIKLILLLIPVLYTGV